MHADTMKQELFASRGVQRGSRHGLAQVRGHPVQKLAVYLQLIRARRLVAKVFLDNARRYRNHVLTLPVFDQIQSLPQGNT